MANHQTMDAETVTNVVNGVISVLGLQHMSICSSGASDVAATSDVTAAKTPLTWQRSNVRLVCYSKS